MQGGREGPPKFVNASVCDKICSQIAAHSMIAALFSRERTGEGQMVEVPMFESMVGFNLVEHHSGQAFEPPLGPAGYERSMVEYRKPFATADGYVCALPYNTKQWRSFFAHVGREDTSRTPRQRSEASKRKDGELYQIVAEVVKDWTTDDILGDLGEGGRAARTGDTAWRVTRRSAYEGSRV